MRRRALRALAGAARAGALAATFAGALVAGVAAHADLPAFRRLARSVTNDLTAGLFQGSLVLGEVDALSIGRRGRVRTRHVEIADPEGRRVVGADGVEGSIDLVALLRSVASGDPPRIELDLASVDGAELVLDRDEGGRLGIERALRPRKKSATRAAPKAPDEEDVVLRIADARVRHAWVHGDLVPPALDGDVEDVRASLSIEKNVFHLAVREARAVLRAPALPGQGAPLDGRAWGELSVALAGGALAGRADFAGECAGLPIAAHAEIDGERVAASVDVARTEPEIVARAMPASKIARPVELHAKAAGRLPTIALDVQAKLGDAELVAKGELDTRAGNAFHVDADVSRFDARAIGSVPTDLSGHARAEGVLGGPGSPLGSFRVTTRAGVVSGEPVPPVSIEGRFEPSHVTATLRASEPGVEAQGKLALDVPSGVATFDLQARSSSLAAVARAKSAVQGAASARARGKIDLRSGAVHGTASADAERFGAGALSVGRAHAQATFDGPVASPVFDVTFEGDDVRLTTPGKTPLVHPRASGRARVVLAPAPRITSAVVHVGDAGRAGTITATADAIELRDGGIDARGLRVSGLGAPVEIETRVGAGGVHVRAKGEGVEAHRVAALTGIGELRLLPEGTRASFDVDVHADARSADGHVDFVVQDQKEGLLAEAHATLDRGRVLGAARLAARGLGHVDLTHVDVTLPSGLTSRSLRRATGVVEVRGEIDLAGATALVAGPSVERASGLATIEGRVERGDPDALPAVRATVHARGVEVTTADPDTRRTTTVSGIDGTVHVAWDGRTEDAEIAYLAWDEHGMLTSGDAKAKVPLAAWASGRDKLDANALARLDVNARLELPERDAVDLPPFLLDAGLTGTVSALATSTGHLSSPRVLVAARASGLREARRRRGGLAYEPLDGTLEARWDGERVVVALGADERPRASERLRARVAPEAERATTRPKRGHLRGLVFADVRASDLLAGRLLWKASGEVDVVDMQLSPMPLPRRLSGAVTGRVRVRDLNGDASIEASGHVDGFGTGGATLERVDFTVGARDGSVFASARAREATGSAKLEVASRSLRWRGLDVEWDASDPTRVDYSVENMRLAIAQPLMQDVVSELDGVANGRGSVMFDARSQTFDGGLTITKGRVYVNAVGDEFTDITASAKFDRSGVFRVDDAVGRIGAGEFRASATGRMRGLSFESAEATVVIPSKEGIPLSTEGATFAEATGEVRVSARMSEDDKALLVTMEVPRAELELPDRSTSELQSLKPDPAIAVGLRRSDGTLEAARVERRRGRGRARSGDAKTATTDELVTRVTMVLGSNVVVEGRGMRVALGGRTLVEIADEVKLSGRLDLRGGTIEVYGRRFTVEQGTITFPAGGEIGNPTVVAAAYWDSPDRTRVWVEFTGPLETGKLTLRSEPPYSKNEILSVLLFGRPDPNQAAAGATKGDSSHASAIAAGFAATDLNRVLGKIDENLDYEADTLSGNRARPKIGRSFFDRRLKVQVGYAPGPTFREPDTTFLFLNWQFVPKWSLVATRGDRGTSILDVLFQHRY